MWRAITDDDLLTGMNSYELEAFRNKAIADGQADPVPLLIAQTTMDVREAIRSCRDNSLSPDATLIPEGAIRHAVALIRHRLQTRFPDQAEAAEDRRLEYREANKYLEAVASCSRSVERYGEAPDAQAPQIGPRVDGRDRRFTRADQDGI